MSLKTETIDALIAVLTNLDALACHQRGVALVGFDPEDTMVAMAAETLSASTGEAIRALQEEKAAEDATPEE